MSEVKANTNKKVLCKGCQQVTNHSILFEVKRDEFNEESEIGVYHVYNVLECLGCGNVCFLDEYTCTEDYDPETGQLDITCLVYPSPKKEAREEISRLYHVPETVKLAYKETLTALNAGLTLLSAVGVRLTIEAFCIDQAIVGGNLEQKIDKLRAEGKISDPDATVLHVVRKMGNESAHKLKKHGNSALSLSLDIVEGLLRQAYIHPKEAKMISEGWIEVE